MWTVVLNIGPSSSIPPFFDALEKGEVTAGMVVIFRYQGPKGAPGMPEVRTHR